MTGVVTLAVIVARTKKKLEEAGATSDTTAKTPQELGLDEGWLKASGHAGVTRTEGGKYFLKTKSAKSGS